jgi:hypothetical protein
MVALVTSAAVSRMGVSLPRWLAALERILQLARLLNSRQYKRSRSRMRMKKQSMREIRDAAAVDRASGIVAEMGDIALEVACKLKPLEQQRVYVRGALIKMKRTDNRK